MKLLIFNHIVYYSHHSEVLLKFLLIKDANYIEMFCEMLLTISLMREIRVGGAWRPNRVANRRCFSTMMPSMSRRRAMSVRSGVIGMDSVAKRTLVDILQTEDLSS